MKKQIYHILAKTPLFMRVVSLYAIVALVGGYVIPLAQPVRPAVNSTAISPKRYATPLSEPAHISGGPVRIELPRIGLVREVINGEYNEVTGEWTLTDDKTQFAAMTSTLNNRAGQTVIYGHNTPAVLEPVRLVEAQDILKVQTENGHVFTYTYSHDRVVEPADVSVLFEQSDTPRIVLMTCEGWFSETRRLLYFNFKEIQ